MDNCFGCKTPTPQGELYPPQSETCNGFGDGLCNTCKDRLYWENHDAYYGTTESTRDCNCKPPVHG